MKKYSIFKIFRRYIYDHRKSILYLGLILITFAIVLSLYDLNLEALFYASVLSGFLGLVIVVIDFIHYFNRYITLKNLENEIVYSIENLPSSDNLIQKSLNNLIEIIYENNSDYKFTVEKNQVDMMDYYTMWVHQVKTPISAMRLLLQSENFENSKELESELFKIEQYVDMVLSYLRIDSNSTDFLIKSYNLNDIVKQSIRKYGKSLILKKISLNLEDISCSVLTDEKWLSFIIDQILSNALKYTNTGGSIHIYEKSKVLYIQDTGIGISEEDLPRVFDKGFTGYNGRLDKKATGIGLYLCKKIISKLGYSIEIKSKLGEGTTIILDLNVTLY